MAENGDTRDQRVIHAAREFGAVVLNAPEVNMAIFALLLNYPWELLQAPLYLGMPQPPIGWQSNAAPLRRSGTAF